MNYFQNIQDRIESIPHHLDFIGQKHAEKLFQCIIVFTGIIGFIWGYYCQQISQTLLVLAIGFVLSIFLVVIPWPCYRKNPLSWQKVMESDPQQESGDIKKEKPANKQKKNKKSEKSL